MLGPDGAPLAFEIMVETREQERLALAYAHNLARIGVAAAVRLVDDVQFQRRRGALRLRHDARDLDRLALARQRAARTVEFGGGGTRKAPTISPASPRPRSTRSSRRCSPRRARPISSPRRGRSTGC